MRCNCDGEYFTDRAALMIHSRGCPEHGMCDFCDGSLGSIWVMGWVTAKDGTQVRQDWWSCGTCAAMEMKSTYEVADDQEVYQ